MTELHRAYRFLIQVFDEMSRNTPGGPSWSDWAARRRVAMDQLLVAEAKMSARDVADYYKNFLK